MFDDLTPLRRAYGVEAPAERRTASSGADGSAAEEAVLRQSRTALEATVGAQDRQPATAVLEAVRAEAARASAEALAPLTAIRALYGAPTAAAPTAAEAALLAQTRAAVEQTVDARPQSPSADAVASVLAFAAAQTRLAPRPDAAVEVPALTPLAVAYGLPLGAGASPAPVETVLLAQTRALLDDAPVAVVSESSVAAVLAAAAAATRLAPRPDAPVEAPELAPLAVAFGLPLGAGLAPAPAETVLLVQTRALLDEAPATAGPSEAVLSTVLARAALARPEAPRATDRPVESRPAPDREPVRAARSYRRAGAWASAAMALAAVLFVLMPRTAVAPELDTPGTPPASIAAATPAVAEAVSDDTEAQPADPQVEESASFAFAAPAAEPVAAPSAPAPSGPSSSEPVRASLAPAPPATAPRVAAPRPTPVTEAPRTVAPRPVPSAASAAETTTALVSADVTPANGDAWDVQDDVRVLSLRLQELRRGNEGLAWDTPTEAFGAPTTRSSASAPGLQSVRETFPAARARLVTPVTGDR